jgi:hypothetical protein
MQLLFLSLYVGTSRNGLWWFNIIIFDVLSTETHDGISTTVSALPCTIVEWIPEPISAFLRRLARFRVQSLLVAKNVVHVARSRSLLPVQTETATGRKACGTPRPSRAN